MTIFQLNMQILYDALSDVYQHIIFRSDKNLSKLEDIRFFQPGQKLSSQYIYLIREKHFSENFCHFHNICFIASKKAEHLLFGEDCSELIVQDCEDSAELFTLIQDTFEKYRTWNLDLEQAKSSLHPLDEMLKASMKIFQNPMFAHDSNFYLLSCPKHVAGMPIWEKEPRTGLLTIPLDLIHEFKVDLEYLNTLNTKETSLYSAELRGYPVLYINLWNHKRYEGRICVDELETPIRPGQYLTLQYLGNVIIEAMNQKNLLRFNMGNDMIHFFCDYLDGTIQDQFQISRYLFFLNWNQTDHYFCLRLETVQQGIQILSSAATLGYIETRLPESYAFIYQNGISVIINLTFCRMEIPDILQSLAILLREGLLKMGASSELHDFLQIPQGYLQAKAALELGMESDNMNWYYRFDDYILEFLITRGIEQLSPELLCSNKLLKLKQYDKDNHTELYQTLKIYLDLERNALQTSKSLFIHRSTLFYRLERIQKIAGINLEDSKERLILRISYYILEHKKESFKAEQEGVAK